MERFNKIPDHRGLMSRLVFGPRIALWADMQPTVYVTYQAYLRRSAPVSLRRRTAAPTSLTYRC